MHQYFVHIRVRMESLYRFSREDSKRFFEIAKQILIPYLQNSTNNSNPERQTSD
jgi:hypothetical protein